MKMDVGRVDRIASVLVTLGLVPLLARILLSEDHTVPAAWPLALLAAFVAVKGVVAVLGWRAGWRAWPALALEVAALALVGLVVWRGMRSPIPVVIAGVALVGAYVVRRRAAVAAAAEGGYGSAAPDAPEPAEGGGSGPDAGPAPRADERKDERPDGPGAGGGAAP